MSLQNTIRIKSTRAVKEEVGVSNWLRVKDVVGLTRGVDEREVYSTGFNVVARDKGLGAGDRIENA